MTLIPGTRLGPYEIVEQLGQGGMGIVFRARDTKLEREAKAVAALSHPNILAIHDFGRRAASSRASIPTWRASRSDEPAAQSPLASRKPRTVSQ